MAPSHLSIDPQNGGQRMDVILARAYPWHSRAYLQKAIRQGGVTLGGAPIAPSYRAHPGEIFEVSDFGQPSKSTDSSRSAPPCGGIKNLKSKIEREPSILYEDEALLAVDKPAGVVVHPGPGHTGGTLVDWLRERLGPLVAEAFSDPSATQPGGRARHTTGRGACCVEPPDAWRSDRLGLVHRLDKETSGVLLMAKSVTAQSAVRRQFHDRCVEKTYAAFIEGALTAKRGVISAPVGRSHKGPTRMRVSTLGRPSETAFQVKENFGETTRVALFPKTGRTHQIRVHLSAIGHPVVGDRDYGADPIWAQKFGIKRPLLHAESLKITHPLTGEAITFKAPWPDDFRQAQARFREVFKLLVIGLIGAGLCVASACAQESAPHRPATAGSSANPAKSASSRIAAKISALSSTVRKLQSEIESLRSSMDSLSRAVEAADAPRRLSNLEQALSQMNGKVGGAANSLEEAKTQLLELGRRVKAQREDLDGLRDAVDRLQRDVIQLKAAQEGAAPEGGPPKGAPVGPESGHP